MWMYVEVNEETGTVDEGSSVEGQTYDSRFSYLVGEMRDMSIGVIGGDQP